jgi:hypothetical protein
MAIQIGLVASLTVAGAFTAKAAVGVAGDDRFGLSWQILDADHAEEALIIIQLSSLWLCAGPEEIAKVIGVSRQGSGNTTGTKRTVTSPLDSVRGSRPRMSDSNWAVARPTAATQHFLKPFTTYEINRFARCDVRWICTSETT